MDRDSLVDRWFALTRETMPALAAEKRWPVRFDHCFQRILLDNAVGAKWATKIAAPAYENASHDVLSRAIHLGEACVSGDADLAELNRRSLRHRGKLKPKGLQKGRTPARMPGPKCDP